MVKTVRAVSWGWLVAWGLFIAYTATLAPKDDPVMTRALVKGAFTGDFGRVDPAISAVFCALGVVPVLASSFVLRDAAARRLAGWPFALGMFVVGAFALLPWLALRGAFGQRPAAREPGTVRRLLARRAVGASAFVGLTALAGWALARGHADAYASAFGSASIVHVMTIDLVVCAGLLMFLVEEARRTVVHEPPAAAGARLVPLLGSALWTSLVKRSP